MPRHTDDDDARMTVLDRLLQGPAQADEVGRRDSLQNSIARDLVTLLNSRREEEAIPEEYPEVATSILNFGMPELGRIGNIGLPAEQNRVCRAMEDAVKTFEPRLRRPQVRVLERDPRRRSTVRFRLEATVEELGQREVFELAFTPETGEMTVGAGGAS